MRLKETGNKGESHSTKDREQHPEKVRGRLHAGHPNNPPRDCKLPTPAGLRENALAEAKKPRSSLIPMKRTQKKVQLRT
jgi:hypothetical protein